MRLETEAQFVVLGFLVFFSAEEQLWSGCWSKFHVPGQQKTQALGSLILHRSRRGPMRTGAGVARPSGVPTSTQRAFTSRSRNKTSPPPRHALQVIREG